jgi:hypothetical protein
MFLPVHASLLLGLTAPALAAEEGQPRDHSLPTPKAEDARSSEDDPYEHIGQFGLRLGMVGGMRMVFRKDDSPLCVIPDEGEPQRFCGHAGPWAFESALSFAPLSAVEPFVFGRFGLSAETQTNTAPLVLLGAGARLYTISDSRLKVFIEPAVGLELEGRAAAPRLGDPANANYERDYVFRIGAGLQVDLTPGVGFFAGAGMSLGIVRALHSTLEAQAGVQFRAPSLY